MTDIGYIALFLALLAAAYAAAAFTIGSWKKRPLLIESARNALLAVCGLMTFSIGILLAALLTHQFQIEYVYLHSSTDMSTVFLVTSLWAGSEGSLLFWAWLLSVFGVIAVMARRSIGRELVPYAAAVIMFVQAFIIILILASSDPFTTLSFTPTEGTSLNPLLENIGMILHPPIHFISYAAFTIPFAFGMAALFTGRLGDEWLITIRRWTLFAWMALGISLIIGAWWAYVELNWGGYWGWDPVENAGLMPWLVATAFLHSVKMQQRRGMFKTWNMVLIILAFALTVFGTYINRTGIGQHSFGETPESIIISNLVLSFLAIILVVSIGLLIYRRRRLKGETELESFISRESTFLITTWMLVGAAASVFVGTMLPTVSESITGSEVTVGPDFFNQVNAPLFLAIITLAGICTIIGWRKASNRNLIRNFLWPFATALVLSVVLFAFGMREVTSLVAFPLLLFVLLTILSEWFRGTRSRSHIKKENPLLAFPRLIWSNKPRYGGYIVHLGILILAMGIVGSSVYDTETTAILSPGESASINEYNIRYDGLIESTAPGRDWIVTADVTILKNNKEVGTLAPEKWLEPVYGVVTESAIRSTPADDVWVTLEGWDASGVATLRVLVNPLVLWIWIGGAVVVLGGLIAFWPEQRRITAA